MKGRKLHRFVPLALTVVMVSPPLLAGCAAFAGRTAPVTSQVLRRSPPVQLAIAQVRHGSDAPFELCPIDACPKPTPKTLSSRGEAPVTPMPLAATSSPTPPSVRPLPPALIAPLSPVPLQPVHQTFLEQLMETIGIVINAIDANTRTESLLVQSQSLAEELQKQQEELRQTNAELAEKAAR